MKILQINMCYGTGSTGRTTKELESFLNSNNVENYVAYGFGVKPKNQNHFRIVNKFEYYLHDVLAAISGKQGYFSIYPTKKLIKWISRINPDIIQLRNLHGNCINMPILFNYLKKHNEIDVIITTHDFWLLTGWCTTLLCDKWKKEGCGPCPMFKRNKHDWFFDKSKKVFADRKQMLLSLPNLHVQCVSYFCESIVKQSFFKKVDCFVIYNWINTDVFYPRKRNKSTEKPVVLVVWSVVNDKSSRFKDFYKVATILNEEFTFIILGKALFGIDSYPLVNFLEPTSDLEQLANIYSSADVFFDPSCDDTFGKVVAEALACGTRVVVYNSKALPELVGPNCGKVVEPGDFNACCLAIRECALDITETSRKTCHDWIVNNFSYKKNCKMLLNKYSLIKKGEL